MPSQPPGSEPRQETATDRRIQPSSESQRLAAARSLSMEVAIRPRTARRRCDVPGAGERRAAWFRQAGSLPQSLASLSVDHSLTCARSQQEPGIDYGPNATIRPLGAVGKTWVRRSSPFHQGALASGQLTLGPLLQSIKALLAAQESQYHAHEAQLQTSAERVFKRQKPNPDVCTAVDVLTTGEYRRQPTYLSVSCFAHVREAITRC
jgi:hypothetical protein